MKLYPCRQRQGPWNGMEFLFKDGETSWQYAVGREIHFFSQL